MPILSVPVKPGAAGGLALLALLLSSGCGEETPVDEPKSVYPGSMNISRFVYRDDNRNGRYDMADRPYAGQPMLLSAPDGSQNHVASNISGFTNFKMSLNNDAHPIDTPGKYRLRAMPVNGMEFTSGDSEVELEIEELPNSPGGLIASRTLQPFGVAPALSITGSAGDYSVTSTGPDGAATALEPEDENGEYVLAVSPGEWKISFTGDDHSHTRITAVTSSPVRLSPADLETDGPTAIRHNTARLSRIDFEDLTSSDTLYEIPNGYGGLDWHNWIATHHKFYKGAGYINSTTSGEFIAYNSSGHPASVSSPTPFDLVSVQIGVAWPAAEDGTVLISAWRGETLAYRDEFSASTRYSTRYQADFREVTRVEFRTSQYWQVVIDDLIYRPPL